VKPILAEANNVRQNYYLGTTDIKPITNQYLNQNYGLPYKGGDDESTIYYSTIAGVMHCASTNEENKFLSCFKQTEGKVTKEADDYLRVITKTPKTFDQELKENGEMKFTFDFSPAFYEKNGTRGWQTGSADCGVIYASHNGLLAVARSMVNMKRVMQASNNDFSKVGGIVYYKLSDQNRLVGGASLQTQSFDISGYLNAIMEGLVLFLFRTDTQDQNYYVRKLVNPNDVFDGFRDVMYNDADLTNRIKQNLNNIANGKNIFLPKGQEKIPQELGFKPFPVQEIDPIINQIKEISDLPVNKEYNNERIQLMNTAGTALNQLFKTKFLPVYSQNFLLFYNKYFPFGEENFTQPFYREDQIIGGLRRNFDGIIAGRGWTEVKRDQPAAEKNQKNVKSGKLN